ncbi:MAG: Crp/Fnr family transcriptional regulator [Rhodoferax sp.]|nr:Crp/Fnr family transcriptional regulator [Rhodoferax sp.]
MSINTYTLLKNLGLSERQVVSMLPAVANKTYSSDQIICPKGQPEPPWTHIFSGMVCGGIASSEAAHNPLSIFGPGTWIGEAAFLNRKPAQLEYVCLSPVRVMHIPYAMVQDAYEREPEFSRYIGRMVSWRDQHRIEMLGLARLATPPPRVIIGLALFAEALQCAYTHVPNRHLESALEIPVKQAVLAFLCGVSRGIFSLCLQQLAAGGWCQVSYASITLLRLKTWLRLAEVHRSQHLALSHTTVPELIALMAHEGNFG